MNTFGHQFKITVFGESHGEVIGVVIDGARPGMPLCAEDFAEDLARRRGGAPGTTSRKEEDMPRIISGIYNGCATGTPITILFENKDARGSDYDEFITHPRPGHADLTAAIKYNGLNDHRGGGQFSGRMTLALVAAGVVAKKLLGGINIEAKVISVGGESDPALFAETIAEAAGRGDSVGGMIEVTATGVPAGTGEPFFRSVESVASQLFFSIPGVKGVEFGAGFATAWKHGSRNNDMIIDADGRTATNNDGGINGGIANGNPIVARIAVKPTPSIALPQETYDFAAEKIETLRIVGRHDACIALRAAVVAEAALAIAIADLI